MGLPAALQAIQDERDAQVAKAVRGARFERVSAMAGAVGIIVTPAHVEEIERLLEEEAAAPERSQPIDTAPRDGKVIFVFDEAGHRARAFWCFGMWPEGNMYRATEAWCTIDHSAEPPLVAVPFEPTRWSETDA